MPARSLNFSAVWVPGENICSALVTSSRQRSLVQPMHLDLDRLVLGSVVGVPGAAFALATGQGGAHQQINATTTRATKAPVAALKLKQRQRRPSHMGKHPDGDRPREPSPVSISRGQARLRPTISSNFSRLELQQLGSSARTVPRTGEVTKKSEGAATHAGHGSC
jgi:hypothetical protein